MSPSLNFSPQVVTPVPKPVSAAQTAQTLHVRPNRSARYKISARYLPCIPYTACDRYTWGSPRVSPSYSSTNRKRPSLLRGPHGRPALGANALQHPLFRSGLRRQITSKKWIRTWVRYSCGMKQERPAPLSSSGLGYKIQCVVYHPPSNHERETSCDEEGGKIGKERPSRKITCFGQISRYAVALD